MKVRLESGEIIEVPKGATQAEARAIAKKRGLVKGSALDPLMQGLTFGFADELGSAGAKLGRWLAGAPKHRIKSAGERELARQRENLEAYRQRDPLGAFGLELGGSLVSGVPAFKGLMGLGRAAGLSRAPAMVGAGTLEGALAGAGAAEEDKGTGAAVGGLFGLGTSALVPAIGYAGKRAYDVASDLASPLVRRLREEPTTTASRLLSESLETENITPAVLRARAQQMGPQATIADIGGYKTLGLSQGVVVKSGDALARARREFEKRSAGSTARIKKDIAEATGEQKRMLMALDEINDRQKAASKNAYTTAHSVKINPADEKLTEILNRPSIRDAIPGALKNAKNEGRQVPILEKIVMKGDDWTPSRELFPDMQALDDMKKALDDMVKNAYRRGDDGAWSLKKARNALRDRLDELNPAYKTARNIWAGDQALKDAIEEGEMFLTRKTRQVEQYLRDAGASEKEAYLTGAVEAIREKMGRATAGQIKEFNFLETGNAKENLRMLFPKGPEGDRKAGQLFQMLDRERKFATIEGWIVKNSQTELRKAGGEMVQSGVAIPTSAEMMANPISGTIAGGLEKASRALSNISNKSLEQLGEMLFTPGNVETVIAELQRRGIPQRQITQFVNRFSMGSAALSPYAGMFGGSLVSEQ